MNSPCLGRFNRLPVPRNTVKRIWERIVPTFAFKNVDSATRHDVILARVSQAVVSKDIGNSHLGKTNEDLGPDWNDHGAAEWAEHTDGPLADAFAAAVDRL